ncbi:methionyl-tRNA formyltransferase [Gammaproteobacteria bacterium]|nr:methionyl-tRNA formyltransferase [Gammaproteobacteria bacterium]
MAANEYLNKAIVYAGSDIFSIPSLQRLLDLKYKKITVLTKSPKRQGRGMKVKNNPLAQFSSEQNIETLMPEDLDDGSLLERLKEIEPEVLITSAYGKLVSKTLLDVFSLGNINIHPSLLPRWRGPSPIESAILEGDTETGVTLMQMTEELDAGPIYAQKSIPLGEENTKRLSEKLSLLAANMLEGFLPSFLGGFQVMKEQDERCVTHSKMIKKEHARIDWNENPKTIDKKIKAYYPWPVAHTYLDNKYFRIWDSKTSIENDEGGSPGEIVDINKEGLVVKCSGGRIILKGVQPEGKKEMLATDYARGNKLEGKRFS